MVMTLCPSNAALVYFIPVILRSSLLPPLLASPSTFKLDYSREHTQLLLDQVFNTAISGYVPNTKSADPEFGKALQCAAIDRARYKVNPVVPRSSACVKHFERYCWDPTNLPSVSQLPGRKLTFVDPDPEGVTAVTGFLSRSKVPLILAFLFLAFIVAALSAFLCVLKILLLVFELILNMVGPFFFFFCRILRKRRQHREAAYQKVMELHNEDEPPFLQHDQYRDDSNSESTQVYQLGRLQYEPFEPEPEERQ
jgi:lysophospholipase